MKFKKGDTVIMLSGKDRGKTGKVLRASPEDGKITVEGLNTVKRHVKARQQGQKGQVIARERFISASAAALVCKACGKPTRVGYRVEGTSKARICKKCGAEV